MITGVVLSLLIFPDFGNALSAERRKWVTPQFSGRMVKQVSSRNKAL
jgi:hypothetical protein